jgi:lipoprotein-anchoring transpeptidase ErfK/SrfK
MSAEKTADIIPLTPTPDAPAPSGVGRRTILQSFAAGVGAAFAIPGIAGAQEHPVQHHMAAGTTVQFPDAAYAEPRVKAAFISLSLTNRTLEAFDANTNLLAHFPCSIAKRMEKRPVGELRVAVLSPNPNYTFDPEVFPESPEARQLKTKLILPPGPNNPVGVAWIGLDKPGYGIHGTPSPEQVGRTESHGCFRLANWNAEYLLKLVSVGIPVYVEP